MFTCIIISYDDTIPLQLHTIESSDSFSSIESEIQHYFSPADHVNEFRHYHHNHNDDDEEEEEQIVAAISDNIISTLLIRSRPKRRNRGCYCRTLVDANDDNSLDGYYPPLFAYHIPPQSHTTSTTTLRRNIRATRFAMACGHWSIRFYGTVVLTTTTCIHTTTTATTNNCTSRTSPNLLWKNPYRISEDMFYEIQTIAEHCGPDLRDSIIITLLYNKSDIITTVDTENNSATMVRNDTTSSTTTSSAIKNSTTSITMTEWIGNAAQEQYHDRVIVQQFQQLFATVPTNNNENEDDNDDDDSEIDTNETLNAINTMDCHDTKCRQEEQHCGNGEWKDDQQGLSLHQSSTDGNRNVPVDNDMDTIVTMTKHPQLRNSSSSSLSSSSSSSRPTFCYTCRRPATTLCSKCNGVYFCNDTCQMSGWSHDCLCSIWKIYTDRRDTELVNIFPSTTENGTTDNSDLWYESITNPRECQLSSLPYVMFLSKNCNVNFDSSSDSSSGSLRSSSWWNTELDGWNYGQSVGACHIDLQQRQSYPQGFDPITEIPKEENIFGNPNFDRNLWRFNEIGLLHISSWTEYYQLRQIPPTSPIALLMTYPLTLYYAIVQYGVVPCTIAYQIEHRPLRIHIVGVEKELNFLDIYKELAYLLPSDFNVELVFCIRPDMIPTSLVGEQHDNGKKDTDHSKKESAKMLHSEQYMETIHISVVCGIYGDESSLHPNFDCGSSGPPDMIVAYNAGLYAYESWRYMINYLYETNTNAIGVCSDYNEHSAVQCAAILGGRTCQNSVRVNPFRQPRAMPVYSMNLPQYSNGFLYVVNEQSLE